MHQIARARFAAVEAELFERQAPVIYSAGTAPYPTSAKDMVGWLIDHYQEHISQIESMLAQWKDQQQP